MVLACTQSLDGEAKGEPMGVESDASHMAAHYAALFALHSTIPTLGPFQTTRFRIEPRTNVLNARSKPLRYLLVCQSRRSAMRNLTGVTW